MSMAIIVKTPSRKFAEEFRDTLMRKTGLNLRISENEEDHVQRVFVPFPPEKDHYPYIPQTITSNGWTFRPEITFAEIEERILLKNGKRLHLEGPPELTLRIYLNNVPRRVFTVFGRSILRYGSINKEIRESRDHVQNRDVQFQRLSTQALLIRNYNS